MAPASPESEAPRKRRRTALACEECRDRKRKCDGVKPICGACKSRSNPRCVWKQDRNSKGWWSNSYVQELKGRIRELEETQKLTRVTDSLAASVTPISDQEVGGALTWPNPLEDPPTITFIPQDVSYDHPDPPNETLPSDTRHCTSVQWEVLSNEVDAPDVYRSKMPSPLASTAATPIENISAQPSAPRASFTFNSPPKIFLSSKDHQEENYISPGLHDTGARQPGMDAMGVVVSTHGVAPPSIRRLSDYFGPSSTIDLLRETWSVMGRRSCGHRPSSPGNSEPCTTCESSIVLVGSESPPASSTFLNRARDSTYFMFGMSVPPRPDADRLVNLFWTYAHSLYPFLHWPSFYARYLILWSPQASLQDHGTSDSASGYYSDLIDPLFHCMLNIVFALGTLHDADTNVQDRDDISYAFFKRAKGLLDIDALESGSIALVQILLLMGQYLQTRDMTSSCWNIVGMAIRVAQGIGLHCQPEEWCQGDSPSYRQLDQLEEEMRRRAWAGCVLLDRILSLTYGRPLMIHSRIAHNQLSLPSSIDDELLTCRPNAPGLQTSDTPSLTECYIQALKLQDILGEVLTTFYYQGSENGAVSPSSIGKVVARSRSSPISSVALQKVLDVDGLLDTWSKDLPAHLQVHSYSDEDLSSSGARSKRLIIFRRQATVLKARYLPRAPRAGNVLYDRILANYYRYLYVRMILHRPLLSELCNTSSRPSAESTRPDSLNASIRRSMLTKTGNLCASVAQELVHLITENSSSRAHILPPPWYNVLYIHGCALVLLLSSLCLPRFESIDRGQLMTDWNRCLTFLRGYGSQSRSAQRCIRILELLEEEASSYNSSMLLEVMPIESRHSNKIRQGSKSAKDLGLSKGDQSDMTLDARSIPIDPILGNKGFPPELDISHERLEAGNNWMNSTDGMNWFSLAPFFEENRDWH